MDGVPKISGLMITIVTLYYLFERAIRKNIALVMEYCPTAGRAICKHQGNIFRIARTKQVVYGLLSDKIMNP